MAPLVPHLQHFVELVQLYEVAENIFCLLGLVFP
jgi:hypothetical protein